MRLKGKRALLTACAQGIGRATAIAFAREGATVFATDVNEAGLAGLPDGVETFGLDVLDGGAVEAAIDRVKPDVLFNCAGVVHAGTLLDASDEDFDLAFTLNVKSMFRATRAAVPGMIERGGGTIVNIASAASSIIGVPNRCVYSASKAAIIGLTKSIAVDFVKENIRCNAICPGTVDSPSLHERLRATGDYDAALTAFIARQPMGRIASPDEIAMMAVYLASDESAFVTGQACIIDGGWSVA
ncbi:SDR family oxidoreductase [Acuticoccus mangrovi]|uniref:SDR family oxidoreductase n=1 Tax=Acuticoccus mangrovi TaxID=2796142 RepID=A0A934IL07_9HYPH|nr:SDR family oxidoreductase [Acuticoccus mangrovi]MBJ3778579.1 SDR family oxidoreductase [Acuticoccus mangrovi]